MCQIMPFKIEQNKMEQNKIEQNKMEIRQAIINMDKEIKIKFCYCDKIFSSKYTLTRYQKVNCGV
jgi:hypothetical protein